MAICIDVHCHILPNVDDGAQSVEESMSMLTAAKKTGITTIVATPHLTKQTNVAQIKRIFSELCPRFEAEGIKLYLGFECHHLLLEYYSMDLSNCCIHGTKTLLLEFSISELPLQWENNIAKLQQAGIEIIIAHPERYKPIQDNVQIAERMVQIGCELQISADSLLSGIMSPTRRCAKTLLQRGLIGYIASDAHRTEDYQNFELVLKKYGHLLEPGLLLKGIGENL